MRSISWYCDICGKKAMHRKMSIEVLCDPGHKEAHTQTSTVDLCEYCHKKRLQGATVALYGGTDLKLMGVPDGPEELEELRHFRSVMVGSFGIRRPDLLTTEQQSNSGVYQITHEGRGD